MKLIILIFLFNINFSYVKIIKNGVYNIMIDESYLYYYKSKNYITDNFKFPNTFYRIKKVINDVNSDYKNIYYNVEELYTNIDLSYLKNKELIFSRKYKNINNLWEFIEINNNSYAIHNKNNCYIQITVFGIICNDIQIKEATKFKLIKIYNEAKNNYNNKLLKKEPIDVLIKYIDLNDPLLHRDNIHQIEKDNDNEELRYSLRSILNNIPWIRKIFILMPNERVRYFKDYNLIKNKIVYVRDRDLLGYDSSNSLAFQYRYWKMKKFGISDNIIIMDDDCFIGKKLNKSNFFYINNGKVTPLIITYNFLKINKTSVEQNCEFYKEKAENSKEEQNDEIFNYSKYLTFSFILNFFNVSFNESIFIPKYTHNAIPINLKDVKEIYDIVYKSEYKSMTLDYQYRSYKYLQFQIFILSYTFLKYNRKVKNIDYKFIQLNKSISANYNFQLFCINKGPGNYTLLTLNKAKIIMEYLFPNPTPYELIDYSFSKLAFNVTYSMDQYLNSYENKQSIMSTPNDSYYMKAFILIFIFLLLIKIVNLN